MAKVLYSSPSPSPLSSDQGKLKTIGIKLVSTAGTGFFYVVRDLSQEPYRHSIFSLDYKESKECSPQASSDEVRPCC